jgi:putative transposase
VTFWRCYYHVIWATKYRAPLITPEIEPIIFGIAHSKSLDAGGKLLAVNAVEDHVHLAATIPPRIALSAWVKQIKDAVGQLIFVNHFCVAPPPGLPRIRGRWLPQADGGGPHTQYD